MGIRRRWIIACGLPLLLFGILFAIFVVRPPVLVVTDGLSQSIYGRQRTLRSQLWSSLRLYRRVVMVEVQDGAGYDLVVFAVEASSSRPYGVIFPYRYLEEARIYCRENPEVPTALLYGRVEPPPESSGSAGGSRWPLAIADDTLTDLYRAGRAAAILASAAGKGEAKNVLVFQDDILPLASRNSINLGLREGGLESQAQFIRSGGDYGSPEAIGSAIIIGGAQNFLGNPQRKPGVLFSWSDPSLVPSSIALIFDDSPWALVLETVKILKQPPEEGPPPRLPSRIILRRGSPLGSELRRQLKGVLKTLPPRE